MANNPNLEYAREFGNGTECLTYVQIVAAAPIRPPTRTASGLKAGRQKLLPPPWQ